MALVSGVAPIQELKIKIKRDAHIPEVPDKVLDSIDKTLLSIHINDAKHHKQHH